MPISSTALSANLNERQLITVWQAAASAAAELDLMAGRAKPQNFTDAKTKSDAMVMVKRFLSGDHNSRLPGVTRKRTPIPTPEEIEKAKEKARDGAKKLPLPIIPGIDGKWLLILVAAYLVMRD